MAAAPTFFLVLIQCIFVVGLMSIGPVYSIGFNATVSLDGIGDFRTVGAAISAAPNNSNFRFYIRVKPGTYRERIEIPKNKRFVALIGDDAFTTIIVSNRSNGTGFRTSDSATLTVYGNNFKAEYLTFENSAGPKNGQAVAVFDKAEHTSYYKCRFLGFQDTLYVNGKPQFFKECDIYGSVDFIFGYGLVLFQDCNIYPRMLNKFMTVTAQSKNTSSLQSGFTFQNCTVKASPEIIFDRKNVHTYLGRPWRNFSKVIFMESFLDDVVLPEGWTEWPGVPVHLLFYSEYNNHGPGADVSRRVNWSGFHLINKEQAIEFTADIFINASQWLPETGVPYRSGLLF